MTGEDRSAEIAEIRRQVEATRREVARLAGQVRAYVRKQPWRKRLRVHASVAWYRARTGRGPWKL